MLILNKNYVRNNAYAHTELFRHMKNYRPLRLRQVLIDYQISQRALGAAVRQLNGEALSQSGLSLLLNWNTWPAKTPAHSIRKQAEDFLLGKKVPASVVGTIWEVDDPATTPMKKRHSYMGTIPPRLAHLERFKDFLSQEISMLSDEAKQQFGITHSPFINDLNAEADLFTNKKIIYVRNVLWNTAKLGGFVALCAEVGAGKSTLRRWVEDRIARENEAIRVIAPKVFDKARLTAGMICEAIIRDLMPDSRIPTSLEARARLVNKLLEASLQAGNKHVIIIEEAHLLTIHMIKLLKPFIELEKGFKKMLSIILLGQPELLDKLNARMHPEAREVIQRIEVLQLPALDNDVKGYLTLKLKRIGVSVDQVFANDAYDAIVQRLTDRTRDGKTESICYPLTINNLAIKAMNEAVESGLPKVTADVIKQL